MPPVPIVDVWRSRHAALSPRCLDERTWNDLDLEQIFAALDRTVSTLGREGLYARLRSMPVAPHAEAFEALVTRFTTDDRARERAERALGRLQDPHGYDVWWLARPGVVDMQPWHAVFPVLTATTVLTAVIAASWHIFLPLVIAVVATIAVSVAVAARVSTLGMAIRQVAPIVATGKELAFLASDDAAPIAATVPRDAASLARLKTIARWVSRDPFMASFRPDAWTRVLTDVIGSVYDYLNVVFLLDGNAVFFGSRELASRASDLIRLVAAIGDIDAALSVARWRAERSEWSRPHFLQQGSAATLRNIRHPLLTAPVPNSVRLEPGRGILVTGSNMSGKSTFLRTVGVTTVLAQTINTCLADAYSAPVLEVESCIGRSDDLIAGKSYYLAEVDDAVARLRASREPAQHLFLFDELFRGTNALERIAAAEAILRELVTNGGASAIHFAVVATHDGELVGLLSDVYDPYHLADTLGPDGLQFEYRLEPGPATTRNAIALLRQRGAPDSVIASALRRVAALEHQRSRAVSETP